MTLPDASEPAWSAGFAAALRNARAEIALPGELFDSIDVYVKGHKQRRYIFVWHVGKRCIVGTEQGCIALRAVVAS